MEKALALKREL